MQNLIATTFEVVHYIALQAVHYKLLQEVHLSRYNQITGAADSVTGSSDANMTLSGKRASYIADMIKNRGVEQDKIEILYEGGINSLSPVAANRHCRIELMM